jgi:RNA polymerase sigma-70 factor (ECF subfamily)
VAEKHLFLGLFVCLVGFDKAAKDFLLLATIGSWRLRHTGRGTGMSDGDRVWRERGLRSAVLAGDEAAWRQWYDETFAELHAYVAWRCAGLRDLTEEVVQETWLTAVRRIRQFKPETAPFRAWLRGIAANVLRNQLRNWRRQKRVTGLGQGENPTPNHRHDNERIATALIELPRRYEEVLRAKYLDQYSVAAIAAAWEETPKAIESLLTRARAAFRDAYRRME